jgi:hypothetical protein
MTETRNRSVKRWTLAAVLCLVLLCFIPGPRESRPAENKWYAFCEPRSGEVTYGEHLITGRKLMAGPFPGPREAYDWINGNCPRWRCDVGGACATAPAPGQGGEWKVFCGRNDLVVYLGKTYDSTKHILIRESFLGEPDARAWVNQYYPGWLCTPTGAAASGPRTGGNWAVVCSKKHGGVSLTQYPNRIDYHVWGEGFLGESDARAWTNRNCPSWRCDSEGRCLIGAVQRMPEGRPLEVPPDGPSAGGSPGPWGTPPGGWTTPPPSGTKPGVEGVDSKPLRDEYYKQCTAMRDAYAKKNCTPIYSDCANVPRGCYGYVINGALPDGKSQARVGCGRGVVDTYISCLRNCNEQLLAKKLNMFSIEGCGIACRDRAVEGIKACDAWGK